MVKWCNSEMVKRILDGGMVISRAQMRVWTQMHKLSPSQEPLVTIYYHIISLISNNVFTPTIAANGAKHVISRY